MSRINEEPCLLIRHFLLLLQHDDTKDDNHNQYQQNCISHHSPQTGPYWRGYNNLNVPSLIGLILLFIGYGANLQRITARRQISDKNPVILTWTTPFFMITINFP